MVTIKSQDYGISILLDSDADFDDLKVSLRNKISEAKNFFEGASINIAFRGRLLDSEETAILLDIITTETTMHVTLLKRDDINTLTHTPPNMPKVSISDFLKQENTAARIPTDSNISTTQENPGHTKSTTLTSATQVQSNVNYIESNTAYYQGGLRSGQCIKFDGSVVVMGDANPGSEIIASGNVIVLGALKGMAHAGAAGDISCHVTALTLRPTQLRIANLITYVPEPQKGKKPEQQKPSIAYVKDGRVFVGSM